MHHSTAGYHLARLERRGVVVRLRHRGRVHAFLAGVHAPRDRVQAVLARSAASAGVLARVGDAPQRLGPIASGLPITKAAVYWHLQRLAALGLVHMEGPPRARTYRLLAAAMLPLQPAAPALNQVPVAG